MPHIQLTSAAWSRAGGSHARGYAHLGQRFLDASALAASLDACPTATDWTETVGRLNGCFAVVTARGGDVWAAVDRIRSIPLFYGKGRDDWWLSDDAYQVMRASSADGLNAAADAEFRLTGYVTGAETLHPGVSQLQAGECVHFEAVAAGDPKQRRYYAFRHDDPFPPDSTNLIAALEGVHASVFRRLVESVGGRTIVVPLSGGYDSRLIGVSLRDLGVRDVVCYSYGVPGNWESRISEELARYLGFRWEFIPYSPQRWRAWGATERFAAYLHAAGNLASVPHVQDWPAVLQLQDETRIPPGSVFVPGHSGDFLAGSHIPKAFAGRPAVARRELLDALQQAHYSLWEWPAGNRQAQRDQFDRRIEASVGSVADSSAATAADVYERWDLQERQAKFICNSVRAYEDFGFEWRLPLFDQELMDFWARVPLELRVGRALYFDFARRRQALPVTDANRDHSWLVRTAIGAIDGAGLRPVAKAAQRRLHRWRWQDAYDGSPLAWLALVDRDLFRRTYTGKELLHSYMALRYRDAVIAAMNRPAP